MLFVIEKMKIETIQFDANEIQTIINEIGQ